MHVPKINVFFCIILPKIIDSKSVSGQMYHIMILYLVGFIAQV